MWSILAPKEELTISPIAYRLYHLSQIGQEEDGPDILHFTHPFFEDVPEVLVEHGAYLTAPTPPVNYSMKMYLEGIFVINSMRTYTPPEPK